MRKLWHLAAICAYITVSSLSPLSVAKAKAAEGSIRLNFSTENNEIAYKEWEKVKRLKEKSASDKIDNFAEKKAEEEKKKQVKLARTYPASTTSSGLVFQTTAYSCQHPSEGCSAPRNGQLHTATGTVPKFGTVAVDPRVIPLGTKFKIKGMGDIIFTAEDTGGAIKGNRMDLFVESYNDAINWGRRSIEIEIIE